MMKRIASILLTALLIVSLAVPSAVLFAPPKAEASQLVQDLVDFVYDTLSYVEEALTTAAVEYEKEIQYFFYIKEYVLEPLAYYQSGKAIQSLTGGMLAFVSGQSNGTGQAQFIQNLPGHLQSVGDNASQSFLRQLQAKSNSPYANVVAASLRTNYAQQSSLDGFFAANRNTLPQYSSDPQAFLRGDWSKGGWNAWFALTTQSQNNPYTFYYNAQSTHMKLLSSAQQTHREVVQWGQGFMSWCGATEPLREEEACDAGGVVGSFIDGVCIPELDRSGNPVKTPIAPEAPCTNKNGTPGKIQTPGTTITKYLDKSLGLDADKLTKMGNAATQITSLVGTLMETVQLAQTIIGGPQGGLAGVGTSINGRPSLVNQYTSTTTAYGGLNQCVLNQTTAQNSPTNGGDLLARVEPYVAAWTTIGNAAAAASTTVTTLRDTCTTNAQAIQARIDAGSSSATYRNFLAKSTSLAAEAQSALTNYILPTLLKANSASSTAAAAVAKVTEVRAKLAAPGVGDPPVCPDYSREAAELRTLTPTDQDMVYARQDSITSTGAASTTPPGSLVLAETFRSSLIDEMNILNTNATKLLPLCALPS